MTAKLESRTRLRRKAYAEFPLARSICTCGHTGDGFLSAHRGHFGEGEGSCKECRCLHFVWTRFVDEFREILDAI